MAQLTYLAVFQAAAAAVIALLSHRLYERLERRNAWSYWAAFWGCQSLYYAGVSIHYHQVGTGHASGTAARILAAAAGLAAPAFLAAAAWCLRPFPGTSAGPGAAAAVAAGLALAGYVAVPALGPFAARPAPLAPSLLLQAALMLWVCWAVGARLRRRGSVAAWVNLICCGAYAAHLAATGLGYLGVSVYAAPLSVQSSAVGVALLFGILLVQAQTTLETALAAQRSISMIWEVSSEGMRLTDEAGIILRVNPAYCRMMGQPRETLEGKLFTWSYEPGLRGPMLQTYLDRVRRRVLPARYEREFRLWDDHRIWLEVSTSLVPAPGGISVLSVFRESTERKQAEAAQVRREGQLETLVRASRRVHAGLEAVQVMQAVAQSALELTGAAEAAWAMMQDGVLRFEDAPPNPPATAAGAVRTRVTRELRPAVENNVVGIPVLGRSGGLLAYFEVSAAHDGRTVDAQDVLMLEGLAASAAIALENAGAMAAQTQAERQRAQSDQSYRRIVDGTPMGIHFHSLESDGRLVFRGSNPAADVILGIDHRRLIGMPLEEAFPGILDTEIPERYRRTALTGEPWNTSHLEYRDGRIAGAYEVHAFQITRGSMAAMFYEVTEQRRAQEALRTSEARYRLITENSTDTISTHTPEGVFTFVSPASRALCGHDPAELIGRSAFDLHHPDDVETMRLVLRAILAEGKPRQVSYRVAHKDGGWVWVESSLRMVREAAGAGVSTLISVTRNITERRELEEQVRQAQKLESVGRLAGGVAHDFNNLLTVINGYAAMLTAALEASDPLMENVAEIAAAGARATALTQQLLAFSRKQVMQMRTLDLNACIREAEPHAGAADWGRHRLPHRARSGPAVVRADPGQIHQVLLNLVVNARDAMPRGGRLTIATTRESVIAGEFHPLREAAPGPYAVLSVIDTGCGMDEEARSHLFEPFYTTKEAGHGTGLGLATVFGIVKQSGGYIHVESEPQKGSAFRIYLPWVSETPQPAITPANALAVRGWETVLVVEDQPEVRRLMTRCLSVAGYHVLDAADGDEAMAACERHAGPIHLTISDVIMPGMNGRELADRLAVLRPEMKVLFVSGYSDTAIVGVVGSGINYLQKPFSPEDLTGRVRQMIGDRKTRGNILLVDDEAGVRRLLRKVLESAGYTVLEAANGREAMARVRQRPVDLMLTDLVMPEKEGLETIREFRAAFPGVRIVAMSGAFEGRFLKSAAMMGARATIRKPIAPDQLLRTIERVLSGQ